MKRRIVLVSVLSVFALTEVVNAQTSSGTMGITVNVQGSINLTFSTDVSGLAVTGTNTSTASLPFGTVSMFSGTVPANVTKTVNGTTSFALSTPFDVRADKSNSISTAYTLNAQLAVADSTNTWTLGGVDISNGTAYALTAAGVYGSAAPYTLIITIPATRAPGVISNSINFSLVGG